MRVVHRLGDRRDHFETSGDPWELLRTVVRERKAREFMPTIAVLRECLAHPEITRESGAARQRINETLVLMDTVSTWVDEMLRLPHETLMKILELGRQDPEPADQGAWLIG